MLSETLPKEIKYSPVRTVNSCVSFRQNDVISDSDSSNAANPHLQCFQQLPELDRNQHLKQVTSANQKSTMEKWCFEVAHLQGPL